jgi:hypothetical protein
LRTTGGTLGGGRPEARATVPARGFEYEWSKTASGAKIPGSLPGFARETCETAGEIMHQIVTEATRVEAFKKSLSLNGATVVTLVALLDLAAMSGFFILSYLQASAAPPEAARIWKITDGLFAGSLLYLMFASGAYRASRLSNVTAQLTYILVNGLAIALIECAVLWALDLAGAFAWPWDGPINIVSLGAMTMCLIRIGVHSLLISAAERGTIARNIAVVGAGKSGQRLIAQLREQREPWTRVIGIFDDRKERL